ncbi:AMP-binding protein [Pseudomonas fluorescens]|uniref:Long-chain-fatty-acid--CoA ligase FadD13 n=1 Tax=Pseudomonas fluorescens TaxID=294 RepID=A0A5E7UVG2_PSEFL|nr:AMP-binding protein [Pseudomonas fluorescens]VVQ15567.1 Long-chain-fatty-acid--CoA ligase FadD13 [Pseudomonas fluorescens]
MWLHSEIKTLGDIPRYYSRVSPGKIALVDSSVQRSFAELDKRTNRLANFFLQRGLPPESHVAFIGKNSTRYFEALFAANKAACALVPLNWRLAVPELSTVVDDAQIKILLADADSYDLAVALQNECEGSFEVIHFTNQWLDELDGSDADPQLKVYQDQTALLMYTSGTTGKPKGVQLSNLGFDFMRFCEHNEPAYDWKPEDVKMLVMPNFHLVGTGLSVQALYNGATLSIVAAFEPKLVLEAIKRDRPTICALVPTAIQMLIENSPADADFSSFRMIMYAGSPISPALLRQAMQRFGCQFMQFYGATESGGAATLLRPEQHDLDNEQSLKSCGTPLPWIEIDIVSPAGERLPSGEIGEMQIRSPTMFTGYWNNPVATAEVMKNGWYRSGDVGYKDEKGLIYIVDRVKDMIVTGGENVYSVEVEQVLDTHPAVKKSAVIGRPCEKWGEMIVAMIMLEEGVSVTAKELEELCRKKIAGYKVPKEFHMVSSFPLSATGKILKRVMRDEFLAQ